MMTFTVVVLVVVIIMCIHNLAEHNARLKRLEIHLGLRRSKDSKDPTDYPPGPPPGF